MEGKEITTNPNPIITKTFLQISCFYEKEKLICNQTPRKCVKQVCIRMPILQLEDDDGIASMMDYHVQYPYLDFGGTAYQSRNK